MPVDDVKSAARVLKILEQLYRAPKGLRAAHISKALDIPISSCTALLGTMVNGGFVKCDPDNRLYRLSRKARRFGEAVAPSHPLEEDVIHCARQLHRELGVSVAVSRRVGLYIEWAFTLGPTRHRSGSTTPIFKSFNGMAVLSNMSESKLLSMVDAYNERFGRESAVQWRDVVQQIKAFRGPGYVSGGLPSFPGVGAICFRFQDSKTQEEALLTLLIPVNELENRESAIVRAVRLCVAEHGLEASLQP